MHSCEKCYMRPGSDTAAAKGCVCPVLDNGHGHGDPDWMVRRYDCPLHGIDEKKEA